jgi:hypothetical protein
MAKMGNHENRLGPNALTSLVTALKDMRAQEVEDKKDNDKPNLIELEEWVKENKG